MPFGRKHTSEASYASLRTALFFQTFVLLAIAIIASTAAAFALSWHELRGRAVSQLESLAEAKTGLFETNIANERSSVALLGRSFDSLPVETVTSSDGFQSLVHFPLEGDPIVLAGSINPNELIDALPSNFRTQQQTRFVPVIANDEWSSYLLTTPMLTDGVRNGVLIAVYSAAPLAGALANVESVGRTAELLFAIDRGGYPLVLRGTNDSNGGSFVIASRDAGRDPFIEESLAGKTGFSEGTDYAGIDVVASSRTLSSVGWAVVVKVDRYEFMRPLLRLAVNIVGIGLLLVVLLSLSTFIMSKRIVLPLEDLSRKLQGLETKQWKYERSIHTGNELELVDASAFDLAQRLRTAYDHLEDLVAERTKALKTELAEKAAILASMGDGLVVTDAEGVVTYANAAAESMLGLEADQTKGLHVHEAVIITDAHGQPVEHAEHPVSIVLEHKASFAPVKDPQFYLKQKSAHIAINVLAAPILRDGDCIGAVLSIRDVSDARKIDILKSEFISLVSHQLRTPLSTMRWYLELFEDEAPAMNAEQKESVAQIGLANTRMNNLVNALLNASRIELGKFQLSPASVNFLHLLNVTVQGVALPMNQKHIQLVRKNLEMIPTLKTDQSLLALIIDNLVSNAVKYSPENSKVTIAATIDPAKEYVDISFADEGIGIPAEQQKQIGQKLFRGTNARMSDTDGNGLGLYISKLAAEAIGADLTFKSIENEGTTFTLHLPVQAALQARENPAPGETQP